MNQNVMRRGYPSPRQDREPVQISRDPFARATVLRRLVENPEPCHWCGSQPGRFQYGVECDGFRPANWQGEAFCSKSCMEAYHA